MNPSVELTARMLKAKKNRKPLLVACERLSSCCCRSVELHFRRTNRSPCVVNRTAKIRQIALNAIHEAKAKGYDLVIVDTAGFLLAIDE